MHNQWTADITSWTGACTCDGCRVARKDTARSYNVNTISKLLQDEGWNPSKYKGSMKLQLHEYLTKWYFLAEKQMPTPATSLRRNPSLAVIEDRVDLIKGRRQTILSNGDKIRTIGMGSKYTTYVWRHGRKKNVSHAHYLSEAMLYHNDIIDEVVE